MSVDRDKTVRLLVLSDLHLEFGPFQPPDPAGTDVVVLAGDIWTGAKGVVWAAHPSTFGSKPAIYVPGNHEFYGHERTETLALIRQAAQGTNVHVLDRDEVVVRGVRFLGATLWTDFALDTDKSVDVEQAMRDARLGLNDFGGSIRQRARDRAGTPAFTAQQSLQEHKLSCAWLRARLREPSDEASIISTVVVTHHGPSKKSIHPMFVGSPLNPCFCSELPPLFFMTADLWIHGHIHNSMDYVHHRARVVANPRGYLRWDDATENRAFQSDLVVKVPCARVLQEESK